jgi:Domain of unknown function (DUF4282)
VATEPTAPAPEPTAAAREPGFFGRLFDTSFKSFITLSIVQLVYRLFIGLAALGTVGFIIVCFTANSSVGIIALIVSPLFFILYVIMVRIYLELVVVLFRIEVNTRSRNDDARS